MIKTKSVFSIIDPSKDGLRILATRFRGRGMPATRYHVWMANLGPSEALLRAFIAGKIIWSEFRHRYRKELFEGGSIDRRNRTIKNHGQKFTLRLLQSLAKHQTVTLMCHCAEEETRCHRHILADLIRDRPSRPQKLAATRAETPPRLRPLRWSSALQKLPVLSIRQPYAWLVANGIKDIENRSRRTHYRGPILIHASSNQSDLSFDVVERCESLGKVRMPEDYDIGGVVGMAEVVDCVRRHASPWKQGPSWVWVLANARPIRFRECKGAVGFFYPKWR